MSEKLTYETLKDINDSLSRLEESLPIDCAENFANVFILGLPRTGTTLATQVIFNNMGIGCTNNLMARFWKVPMIGCLLSKTIVGNTKGGDYESSYGSTELPWEPHEFGWFWHALLGIDPQQPFRYSDASTIDWPRAKAKICSLNNALGSSLVHKPLELVGYYLEHFARLFSRAIFVYLERDDLDVAYSIGQARLDRTGGLDEWWGSFPRADQLALLKGKPYNIQIAGQVFFLKEMYSEKLTFVPDDRLIIVSYQTLCERPMELLTQINAKCRNLGCEVPIEAAPRVGRSRKKLKDNELTDALLAGFEAVKGMTRHA